MLAKGWLLGVQFEALLQDGLYWRIARHAVEMAQRLQTGLTGLGFPLLSPSESNQIFPIVPNSLLPVLNSICTYEVWSRPDEAHTAVRFVTSFATPQESVDGLLAQLARSR